MKKIGLLSDTHNFWSSKFEKYFNDCDEIWHAGDIGSIELAKKFENITTFRAVYGNIDGKDIRITYPEILRFKIENVDVMIKHIGGYPNRYDASIKNVLITDPPNLFISGHSHILKIMFDNKINCLHINPGAAGTYGIHTVKTLVKFDIDKSDIKNLEIIEINK